LTSKPCQIATWKLLSVIETSNDGQKVSVIIPNYNYGRFLSGAIESVMAQTYSNIEIIVVNNGSTDDSLRILSKYSDEITVVNQANLGQSGARNSGLLKSKGEYIAFLDADDYWNPNKIEKQIRILRPETQLVYCGITKISDNKDESSVLVAPQFRGDCRKYFMEKPGVSIVLSGESTVLFSRNLLEKVGVFDENLNQCAGWDFFRRCADFTEFDFVDEPLSYYRVHSANMSKSIDSGISDIRKAYKKIFDEPIWVVNFKKRRSILRRLEITFIKTYLKRMRLVNAIKSTISLFFI
jgi:glycosyltransferase involved in cell wall biosynthesis